MCTTSQFWYQCQHAATQPFRDGVCCRPSPPACFTENKGYLLSRLCPICVRAREAKTAAQRRNATSTPSTPASTASGQHDDQRSQQLEAIHANHFWHIPSRCFTDPGFQRLDPFAADRVKQQIESIERARTAKYRTGSFGTLRQRLHDLRTTRRDEWVSPPVLYPVPTSPCCQGTKYFKEHLSKPDRRGLHTDDRCVAYF